GAEVVAGLRIPHLRLARAGGAPVELYDPAGRGQGFAVRAKSHVTDSARMPLEGPEFLSGLRIPHLRLARLRLTTKRHPAARGQAFAVRAKSDTGDRGALPLDNKGLLPGLGIPDLHRPVLRSAG